MMELIAKDYRAAIDRGLEHCVTDHIRVVQSFPVTVVQL
jgi:hypothetical protein